MPWKYVMPNDVESLRNREATLARIGDFWDRFTHRLPEVEARLEGKSEWDLAAWMKEQLAVVHPRLRWEFGQDLGGRYLVITCENAHHLRPLTESVLRRSPQLPNWTFREYRPPQEPDENPPLVRLRVVHILGTKTVHGRRRHHLQVHLVVLPRC